jgi:hypothetical protein
MTRNEPDPHDQLKALLASLIAEGKRLEALLAAKKREVEGDDQREHPRNEKRRAPAKTGGRRGPRNRKRVGGQDPTQEATPETLTLVASIPTDALSDYFSPADIDELAAVFLAAGISRAPVQVAGHLHRKLALAASEWPTP